LDRGRRQLAADRLAWQEQLDMDRARMADERRRAEAELDKARQLLRARDDHLQRRSAAVDQLRAEVMRAQRETLELRLATDELWAQLSGVVPPAALTQSLARLRGQLAEQYRLERTELAGQREQLELLAGRLSEQHDKLQRHRQEIETWTLDRRGEIEKHASRLAGREEELLRVQRQLDEKHQRLDEERRLYEAEIRRLLAQLREQDGPIQYPGAQAA
jgi:chromosome segregation ATPase